ncbi:MAG TPA: flagellar basal body rod protein FlgB [Firmicutes bacterium]|nr:flagellar basal body rod protein FlgB [Bacillota bacterium]HHY98102.1 flagellar basal body rod protein FlgB [Bacillota bacterium]
MAGLFTSPIFLACHRALDALSLRHQAISNNIANVNTPGYKAMEVSFEAELERALKEQGDPVAISDAEITVTRENTVYRADGNSVDVDREMARLAENTERYNAIAQLVSTRLRMLRSVVNEGRR